MAQMPMIRMPHFFDELVISFGHTGESQLKLLTSYFSSITDAGEDVPTLLRLAIQIAVKGEPNTAASPCGTK